MKIYEMLLANAMGESGGGGGGGDSDFSTATVTIVNNTSTELGLDNVIYCADEDELGEGSPATLYYQTFGLEPNGSKTLKVPLYKGLCIWDANTFGNASVSGNITLDWAIFITGDGTITITDDQ